MLPCEQVDTIFRQSEQAVTKGLIKLKTVARNAYYGKIPDAGNFPLNSGTSIKGRRLTRIGVPDEQGWRPIEDGLCTTNACSFEPEVISHGNEEYNFSLVQRDLRTDWVCIDSLAMRDMPEDEIMHLEEGLQSGARYVHEEFRRSRFLHFGQNKLVAIVPEEGEGLPHEEYASCNGAEMLNNGYVFELRANGEIDESHIRVAVAKSAIGRIGALTLDMLDESAEFLAYEDQSYLDSTNLFDTLLPSRRMAQQIQDHQIAMRQASSGNACSDAYDIRELMESFGTDKVVGQFAMRADIHAPRFYPDTEFNEGLNDGDFDDENPETWPRFVRVYPYKRVKATVAGVKYVQDSRYRRAPFGIATIRTNRVISVMSFPNVINVGGAAKVGGFGYDGTAQWQNPDWQCNPNRDKGFWKMRFRLAAKPDHPEEGFSWFVRIDRSLSLRGLTCPVPAYEAISEVTPYCYESFGGTASDPGLGGNAATND